jgi:hypothetical protein
MNQGNISLVKIIFILQIAIFAFGTMISVQNNPKSKNRNLSLQVKASISLSLLIAAFLLYAGSSNAMSAYTEFVFIGMGCSFIGDLILGRAFKIKNILLFGTLFFMAANVFYITAFVKTMLINNVIILSRLWVGVIIFIPISYLIWHFGVRNRKKGRYINVGSLIYVLLIGTMAAVAFTLAITLEGKWWSALIGAIAFVISDNLIAITDIGTVRIKNVAMWVWLTYVVAQMGIIYASMITF